MNTTAIHFSDAEPARPSDVGGARSASDTAGFRPSLRAVRIAAVVGILFVGAIFGFFYAWVCSTMWGLDSIDPRTAITAMNGMNGSVRNGVFAPTFFGTPFVLAGVAFLAARGGARRTAWWFGVAAVIYLLGGMVLTMAINVPMNRELADVVAPTDRAAAATIWRDYTVPWQRWNIVRTVFSGIALACAAVGAVCISAPRRQSN